MLSQATQTLNHIIFEGGTPFFDAVQNRRGLYRDFRHLFDKAHNIACTVTENLSLSMVDFLPRTLNLDVDKLAEISNVFEKLVDSAIGRELADWQISWK